MEEIMKTVNILLSAYNGEKFIAEQIESLLAQDYPAVTIHIRDDGSTDRTVEIVRQYTDRPNVKLYEGENVGYRKSFAWLLANCRDADYYAYCDQDDYWMPDKISRAVRALALPRCSMNAQRPGSVTGSLWNCVFMTRLSICTVAAQAE